MSDGVSDMHRDKTRHELAMKYYNALAEYLKDKTEAKLAQAREAAQSVDAVPRGLWGGQTNFAKSFDELAEKLAAGDEECWGKFLLCAFPNCFRDSSILKKMLGVSPFAELLTVYFDFRILRQADRVEDLLWLVNRVNNSDYQFDLAGYLTIAGLVAEFVAQTNDPLSSERKRQFDPSKEAVIVVRRNIHSEVMPGGKPFTVYQAYQ